MENIICYLPVSAGTEINEEAWGLYHVAKKLAGRSNQKLIGILVHVGIEEKCMAELPFDELYHVQVKEDEWYLVDAHLQAYTAICQQLALDQGLVLFVAQPLYHELAVSLSFTTQASVVTHALEIKQTDGVESEVLLRRSVYNEKAQEWVVLPKESAVHYITIDQALLFGKKLIGQSAQRIHEIELRYVDAGNIQFVGTSTMTLEELKLSEARCVIGIGRGVSGCEQHEFDSIIQLANLLHAPIGGSKVADELGLIPRDKRIGASGSQIAADIYIAIGISGSSQHLEGIKEVKHVIAINSDAAAPIFNRCALGIVGNFQEGVRLLIEALQAERKRDGNDVEHHSAS